MPVPGSPRVDTSIYNVHEPRGVKHIFKDHLHYLIVGLDGKFRSQNNVLIGKVGLTDNKSF